MPFVVNKPAVRNVRANRPVQPIFATRRGTTGFVGDVRGGQRLSRFLLPVVLMVLLVMYTSMQSTIQIGAARSGASGSAFGQGSAYASPSDHQSPLAISAADPAVHAHFNATHLPPIPSTVETKAEATDVPPPS